MTISTLKLFIILYAGILFFLYIFQDYLLFFPQPTPTANRDKLQKYQITVSIDDLKVRGWFVNKEAPQGPLIIYYGGNAEEVSDIIFDIDRLKNASILAINYRGYGNSEGKPSGQNLVEDALHIFDYMVDQKNIDSNSIILMGRSLGSGVAVHVASQRRVLAVILITPFDTLENVAKHHYPMVPVKLLLRHKFDSLALAPAIDRPALVLMASKDAIVPNRYSQNLIKHWQGEVSQITIPGAGHNNVSYRGEYWQAINDFVQQLSERKGPQSSTAHD